MNKILVLAGAVILVIGFSFFVSEYNYTSFMSSLASNPVGVLALNNSSILFNYDHNVVMESFFAGVALTGMCMFVTGLVWKD